MQLRTRSGRYGFTNVKRASLLLGLQAALSSLPATAVAQTAASASTEALPNELSVFAGASAWSGHFGAPTRTNIWSVLVGARYQIGGLRVSASIPRMRIESDGSFFAGLGGTPLFVAPKVTPVRRIRQGWGDTTLNASYLLPNGGQRGIDVELSGSVKIPTASRASGLSTRKVDYAGGVNISKTVGRLTPLASVEYRVFGNNSTWHFRNGFNVSAGTSYAVTDRTALLLTYEYSQASSDFIRDAHEVVLGASTPLARNRLRLTSYVSKGLSQGAAGVSGGASLSVIL